MNHSEIVSFLWGVADLIRDTFRRGHYQDVILPLTVLRRLDCVLAGTKGRVLQRQAELRGRGLEELDGQLRKASGLQFYNTSRYDFDKLLADAPHLAANLRNYIAGFSGNMREVLEKFDFDNSAALAHLDFLAIHPYPDGNGRIARLLMNLCLVTAGLPWVTIKAEDRRRYFEALDAATAGGDVRPFGVYVWERVAENLGVGVIGHERRTRE